MKVFFFLPSTPRSTGSGLLRVLSYSGLKLHYVSFVYFLVAVDRDCAIVALEVGDLNRALAFGFESVL
jgi:hypothetical protein